MDKYGITLHEILQMPIGESITGIVSYRDELLIATQERVFRLDIIDPLDYQITKVGSLTNPDE